MRLTDADEVVSVLDYYITHCQVLEREFNQLFVSGVKDGYARARSVVLETPTVDPVKHGHWEEISPWNYKCSVCNAWWYDDYHFMEDFIFCPSCGAKMDEEVSNGTD